MIMGAAAFGVYHGLYLLIHINVICLAAAILVAVPIYFVLTIKLGAVGRKDLLGPSQRSASGQGSGKMPSHSLRFS